MYKKVMLTLDGSALARAAIGQVATLVSGTGAEVVVVHVVQPMDTLRNVAWGFYELTDGEPTKVEGLAEQWHFERNQRAMAEVARAESELRAAGIEHVRTEVVDGMAELVITGMAVREGCDAIVMATRGHGGLGREVIGSVAEYVLRHAGKMAVVLVGPQE